MTRTPLLTVLSLLDIQYGGFQQFNYTNGIKKRGQGTRKMDTGQEKMDRYKKGRYRTGQEIKNGRATSKMKKGDIKRAKGGQV